MRSRALKIGFVAICALATVLGVGAWTLLRTEPIPETLEPVQRDPDSIVIPAIDGKSDLAFADLRGKTAFFVLIGVHSGESKEGQALNRALNRWSYPDDVQGYIIGDAFGFGIFRERIGELIKFFNTEMRFPLYVDFEGAFIDTFKLPKGHHGFVVIDPDGEVTVRKSGGMDTAEIEALRVQLGAQEPDPGPEAPQFQAGDLTLADCETNACALFFLGAPVKRTDVPGIEGGYEDPDDDDGPWVQMRKPEVRLVSTALRMDFKDAKGVLIGSTTDLEFDGWHSCDDNPQLRAQFDIPEGESAVVVVDNEGRIALRERGLVPMYKWGVIADVVGVEINDRKPKGE